MPLKGQEHRGHLSPSELAATLRRERDIIARYIEHARELVDAIAAYERRYEMSSETMVSDLSTGDLEETGDIVDWLITYERYQRIASEWPTLEPATLD
ncbi:MAG: hypothetical protein H0V47_05295 [Chloroflexia bacterium]|nr:hypothetical protein [Chloroflexia bacterium]